MPQVFNLSLTDAQVRVVLAALEAQRDGLVAFAQALITTCEQQQQQQQPEPAPAQDPEPEPVDRTERLRALADDLDEVGHAD